VHLNVRFSTEAEMKQTLDFLYKKSKEGISFTGLVEAMVNEVTIVTAIHNIKSNKGSKTAGVDQMKMDRYLQMPREELIALIRDNFSNYRPKPARRVYIPKKNGKQRPLGIPTVLDRIIQECVRIIIEPICEAKFYPHSYGFRPYRAQKHAIRDIVNVINSVMLDPTGSNIPVSIRNITDVSVNGKSMGLGGYLDIGLIDTMKDLLVNFIGAVVFSVIGYFYIKNRGKGRFARRFIPRLKSKDADFLEQAEEEVENDNRSADL